MTDTYMTQSAFQRLLAADVEVDRCRISADGWCFTHSTGDGPVYCQAAS